MEEPTVRIGILGEHVTKPAVELRLEGSYILEVGGRKLEVGNAACELANAGGQLALRVGGDKHSGKIIRLLPATDKSFVKAFKIPIGIKFHWQRELDLEYGGELEFAAQGKEGLRLVNVLPLEEYIDSVALSEMGQEVHGELKKAHAVIARSWYFAQVRDKPKQHDGFDVCNDDHCQRYQGRKDADASLSTRGKVLEHGGEVVDARYSKSCGGHTDDFASAWEDVAVPYLVGRPDVGEGEWETYSVEGRTSKVERRYRMNLRKEDDVRRWIEEPPGAFCQVEGRDYAAMVQGYDGETKDFYRWRVEYDRAELGRLVEKKTGQKVGAIRELKPLKRGVSGRIIELEIVGKKETIRVSKELAIRSALSETHLYSSCFVVETATGRRSDPPSPRLWRAGAALAGSPVRRFAGSDRIVLRGAGWGHGVGLCQIGAAKQATLGRSYEEILKFYYKGTELNKLY